MPIRILDYLFDDEAKALASFQVEMTGLEEAVNEAVATYYALPERHDEFADQFLNRMTLGSMVERLKPALDHHGVSAEIRDQLSRVIAVRNAVAHGQPTTDYEAGPHDPDEPKIFHVYRTKVGPIKVSDLKTHPSSSTHTCAPMLTSKTTSNG